MKRFQKAMIWCLGILVGFSILAFLGITIAHTVVFSRCDYDQYDHTRNLLYEDVAEEYPRQEIQIQSGDNQLSGFIYGAQNDLGLIVVSPGHTDATDIKLYEILYFVDQGWRVLCYDYTGCYTSEGTSMVGYTQCVHDLDAVLNYVEHEETLSSMPLMLFGHSLGAYNSCAVLQFGHPVTAVVAASGFDTPKEQWNYSIKRFTGGLSVLLSPYTNLFIQLQYGKEAELSAVDGINAVDIPVLVISGTVDEFYGGESPIYRKQNSITNPNCTFRLMNQEGHTGHYDYFLTDEALQYQNEVDDPSFEGAIDKKLYREHDKEFMDSIHRFFVSAIPNR